MLNLLVKGLIVVGAVGVCAGVAYLCNKKDYAEIQADEFEEAGEEVSQPSFKEKAATGLIKAVEFFEENQSKIEAVTSVASLVMGCLELTDFLRGRKKEPLYSIVVKDDEGNRYLANYIRRL